jgi:hypothetical protein
MTFASLVPTVDQEQYTYENSAFARRVTLVDSTGGLYSSTGGGGGTGSTTILTANRSVMITASIATSSATSSASYSMPTISSTLLRILFDISNHNISNSIAVQRQNSSSALQEEIVPTASKWMDSGLLDFPCSVTCAASDKIVVSYYNAAALAGTLMVRFDYV